MNGPDRPWTRIGWVGGTLIMLMLADWLSCGRSKANTAIPEIPFKTEGRLAVVGENGQDTIAAIVIEIADFEEERIQGLMWRRSMPDTCGMLFVFEEEKPLSFWMKNTFIPLDIVFIDDRMKIVNIQENTQPFSTIPIPSRVPARFALEVNAWFCREHGIKIGDQVCWHRLY